jgi:hypothetical protein
MRMVATSLEMLRRHNTTLKIRLYFVDDGQSDTVARSNMSQVSYSKDDLKSLCEKLNVEFVQRHKEHIQGEEGYFYIQRHMLRDVPEDSVLYLDGDTFIFGDVETLFDKYKSDLTACENEWAWGQGFQESWLPFKPFNSGVTLWHNGWFQKWTANLPDLCRVLREESSPIGSWLWKRDGKCLGREEFSISIFIEKEGFSYGYLDKSDCWLNKLPEDYLRAGQSLIFHSYTDQWKKVAGHLTGGKRKVLGYVRKAE